MKRFKRHRDYGLWVKGVFRGALNNKTINTTRMIGDVKLIATECLAF